MRGRARRAPWPDDAEIGGNGYRLGASDESGTVLVDYDPPDQDPGTSPPEFGESAQNPVFGNMETFRDLSFGFGLKHQRTHDDRRYYHALGVDASTLPWQLGPAVTTGTPATRDATNGITRAFEVGGVLYFLNGRYALVRAADATFNVSKDFGVGKAGVDAAAFQSNALSASYAFVAMGDAEKFWYLTGGVWTQHATLFARAWAVAGKEFWRANDTNQMAKVTTDADPTNAANWTAANAFRVGSKDYPITRIGVMADPSTETGRSLWIFKQDGVFTLSGAGDDFELYPFLRFAPSSANGEALGHFRNGLAVVYGNSPYAIRPDGGLDSTTLQMPPENDSPVHGRVTALCETKFALYAGLHNPDTGDSYLMKFGGRTHDRSGEAVRVDRWHGSLTAAFAGKRITLLHESAVGAAADHTRLWIGFSDGTYGYFPLPCTANPAGCSAYRYAASGDVFLPRLHFGFTAEEKAMRAVDVSADNFSSNNTATFSYRLDAATGAYTPLGTTFQVGERQRADFPADVSCVLLDPKVSLAALVDTSSPQITSFAIEQQLRSEPKKVFELLVLAADGLRKRDGTPYRRGPDAIEDELDALRNTAGSVPFVGPDEAAYDVAVVNVRHAQAWDRFDRKPKAALAVRMTEVVEASTAGTWASVMRHVWSEVELYTWAQTEVL